MMLFCWTLISSSITYIYYRVIIIYILLNDDVQQFFRYIHHTRYVIPVHTKVIVESNT